MVMRVKHNGKEESKIKTEIDIQIGDKKRKKTAEENAAD